MRSFFLASTLVCAACTPDTELAPPTPPEASVELPTLEPPDPAEGFQMGIDTEAGPYEEVWDCYVATMPLIEATAVSRVVSEQVDRVHHMDVMALSLLDVPIEDGMHDCATLYETYPQLMEEGTFIYASQLPDESLELPDGVAAVLPPNLRVMIEIHYVNAFDTTVGVWSRVNAYTMDMDDVEDNIWGSAVRDTEIEVPAGAEDHVEWTRCEMNRDIELVFLSSHTHQLASFFEVYAWDGEQTGDLLYTTDDWHAPKLDRFDQLPIAAGTGFEFRCHYDNPTDEAVRWGFTAADEMCQIGIVHTPGDFSASCDIVASSDGLMP